MRKLLLGATLTVTAALALSASAQAVVLVNPDGSPVGGQWQRWADRMRVPSVPSVVFGYTSSSNCPGDRACFIPPCVGTGCTPQIPLVLVRPGDPTSRWDLYHELGHAYDWTHLIDSNRVRFEALMGDQGRRWSETTDGPGGASDDFANDYALCAEAYRPGRRSGYWFDWAIADKAAQQRECRLIVALRNQAGDRGAFATGTVP